MTSSNALFPIRLTEEEILANPEYTAYVILNIPEHGKSTAFDTIGRTTFKKYIIKEYSNFYAIGALKTSNFRSVPFVISKVPTLARVAYKSNKRQSQENTADTAQSKKNRSQNPNLVQLRPSTSQTQSAPPVQHPAEVPPQLHFKNLVEPTLTMDLTYDSPEEYYAPSHCKCHQFEELWFLAMLCFTRLYFVLFRFLDDVKRFKMSTTDLEIAITNENAKEYNNCSTFDTSYVQGTDFWHMIVVS